MNPCEHSRLLSYFLWESTDQYRAVLTRDCVVDLRKGWKGQHRVELPNGLIVALDDDKLTIPRRYASDLTSPAVRVGRWWIGMRSGIREALAALVHDVLRQLLGLRLPCLAFITRRITDDVYFDFLHEAKSRWFRIFHGTVAGPAGTVFMWITSRPESGFCHCHQDAGASQNQVVYQS